MIENKILIVGLMIGYILFGRPEGAPKEEEDKYPGED